MPISKKLRAALLGGALFMSLSGCLSGALTGVNDLLSPAEGPRVLALRGGVSLELPRGLCIDPETSNARRGFALIAACDRFGEGARRGAPVFATLQLGAPGSAAVAGQEDALAAFMLSENGRALLGGEAIADADVGRNQVILQSGSETAPIWRGFADHGGVIAVVTVRPLPGLQASPREGRRVLTRVLGAIRP